MLPIISTSRTALLARIAILGVAQSHPIKLSFQCVSARTAALVSVGLLLASAAVAQPIQKLFNPSELVSRGDENRVAAPDDLEAVGKFRNEPKYFKDVRMLKAVNINALHGKTITLTTPEGVDVKFTGELTIQPDMSRVWLGKTDDKRGMIVIVKTQDDFYADIGLPNANYRIVSPPKAKHMLFLELVHHPVNHSPDHPHGETAPTEPPQTGVPAASGPKGK
jgi:hypothetical protein